MTLTAHHRRSLDRTIRACGRPALLVVSLCLLGSSPLMAQDGQVSRLALDSVAAIDVSHGEGGETTTGLSSDVLISFDLGANLQFVARPFLQRQATTGEWNAQVWLAALRFERTGDIALRVDAGYVPSPVGIANLFLRPHTNPTVALPASLFTPLPLVDVGAPRTPLLGAIYPLGVSATVSSLRWDVRSAVIDSSPVRPRRVFADQSPANPPRFATVVVGGGITPVVGVRFDASVSRGHWERPGESPAVSTSRTATIATLEADVSFGHTRVQAEWVHDWFAVNNGTVAARGWFAQGEHTIAPRWFVAGRVERIRAPAIVHAPTVLSVVREDRRFSGAEAVIGYRLSPELTLRVGHRVRQPFSRTTIDHSVTASLVWWRRWR